MEDGVTRQKDEIGGRAEILEGSKKRKRPVQVLEHHIAQAVQKKNVMT